MRRAAAVILILLVLVPAEVRADARIALLIGTTNIAALEAFLARFRDTYYADLARLRIEELKKQQEAGGPSWWDKLTGSSTPPPPKAGPTGGLPPGSALRGDTQIDGEHSVKIRRRPDGHFIARTRANGVALTMLIDTGASSVVLKPEDAQRLGIETDKLRYTVPVQASNSTTYAAHVRLRTLALGPISLSDVEALVARPNALKENLLGMSFLGRLRSYEFTGDMLTLRGVEAERSGSNALRVRRVATERIAKSKPLHAQSMPGGARLLPPPLSADIEPAAMRKLAQPSLSRSASSDPIVSVFRIGPHWTFMHERFGLLEP